MAAPIAACARFVDEANFSITDQWAINHLLLNVADGLDLDLRVLRRARDRLRSAGSRVRDLRSVGARGAAVPAGIRVLRVRHLFAEQGLRDADCQQAFADSIFLAQ
ncbi:MAG: hypothetical protein U0361_21560 [Nitrospiraceae bacterium]